MDPDLASSYQGVMSELGVDISYVKTHTSNKLFEFAKRFAYNGSEITQFPITALIENMKSYPLFSQVLSVTAPERGFLPLFVLSNSTSF